LCSNGEEFLRFDKNVADNTLDHDDDPKSNAQPGPSKFKYQLKPPSEEQAEKVIGQIDKLIMDYKSLNEHLKTHYEN
jgi:hypothetical protein